jgi:hypothetical protein
MTRVPFLFGLVVSLSCSPLVSLALADDTDVPSVVAVPASPIVPILAGGECPPCECPALSLSPSTPSLEAIQKAFDAIKAVELAEQPKSDATVVPPTLPQATPPK